MRLQGAFHQGGARGRLYKFWVFEFDIEPSCNPTAARHFRVIGNPPTMTAAQAEAVNIEAAHSIADNRSNWRASEYGWPWHWGDD